MKEEYYKYGADYLYETLKTSTDGLSIKEADKRLEKYGYNVLPSKKDKNIFLTFLCNFKDPIVIVLLISSLLSLFIGEIVDSIAIFLIVVLDAIIGTIEESKANKSAKSLQDLIKFQARVVRDKKEYSIDSKELTVGDIVLLEAGDKVPADIRILESNNFTVDESILTGESITVEKNSRVLKKTKMISDISNMVFMGTSVITGKAKGVVVSIGADTEVGGIAEIVNNTKGEKSPLTKRAEKFSKQISVIIVIVSIIIGNILLLKGYRGADVFICVVALAVSAMPEGLPLAFTMALTIGSNKMLKKNVIVKKLYSVESLGSCTVIASDKTGTLTYNEQTAKKIILPNGNTFEITGSGYNDNGVITPIDNAKLEELDLLIEGTTLNNDAVLKKDKKEWKTIGDSIDIAFLALGKKYKIDVKDIEKKESIPYESENKYSALLYEKGGTTYCTAKGSIEVILSFCDTMLENGKKVKIDKDKLISQNEELAKKGYRVIAVASSKVGKKYNPNEIKKLSFLGLVAFIDTVRPNVKGSINKCREAGIKVVMITGDHPLTAFSIAKELNIADYLNDVATGEEIDKYLNMGEIEFDSFVRNKTVFSRVTPLQKLKIVESYKRQGEFIAVTGDGVNDAPALKSANIGIAMGSGTDVAREVASMIITNDDFSSIVDGIEEGRIAYSNIRKITYLLISCGMAEVLFFTLSLIFNMPIPLVAIQLLWINVVTDGLQDLALSFEKGESGIMKYKPRDTEESLFDRELIFEILVSGLVIGLFVFILWNYLINNLHLSVDFSRGCILVYMVFMENIHVLNCRSERKSILNISFKKNPFIILSIVSAIILQVIFMEVPKLSMFLQSQTIEPIILIALFVMAVPILFIMELYKLLRYTRYE